MATKGKNKSYLRRKFRRVMKDVQRDIGDKANIRVIRAGYGNGVTTKNFPRLDVEE